MVTLSFLAVLVAVGLVFALAFTLIAGAVKLVFKVALLPFALAGGLLKVVFALVVGVVLLVAAPVL